MHNFRAEILFRCRFNALFHQPCSLLFRFPGPCGSDPCPCPGPCQSVLAFSINRILFTINTYYDNYCTIYSTIYKLNENSSFSLSVFLFWQIQHYNLVIYNCTWFPRYSRLQLVLRRVSRKVSFILVLGDEMRSVLVLEGLALVLILEGLVLVLVLVLGGPVFVNITA